MDFVSNLSESVKSCKLSDPIDIPNNVQALVDLLENLNKWIDEIPPIQQPQRFGNQAYRIWFKKLKEVTRIKLLPYKNLVRSTAIV